MFPPGENRGHVHMFLMLFHPPRFFLPAEKSAQLGGMYKRGNLVNSIPFGSSMPLGMPTLALTLEKADPWRPRPCPPPANTCKRPHEISPRPFSSEINEPPPFSIC